MIGRILNSSIWASWVCRPRRWMRFAEAMHHNSFDGVAYFSWRRPLAFAIGCAALVYGWLPFRLPLALAVWYVARHLTVNVGWQ